jgi:hypothetical protein
MTAGMSNNVLGPVGPPLGRVIHNREPAVGIDVVVEDEPTRRSTMEVHW